ncbi:MAG: hypothetical protein CMP18_00330 [Rickettsiales bacterium]|nr:hypothetical protein [Rickettsiales bacterium]
MKRNNISIFIYGVILLQLVFLNQLNAQQADNSNNQVEELLLPDNPITEQQEIENKEDSNNDANDVTSNISQEDSKNISNLSSKKDSNINTIMITPDEKQGIDLIVESIKSGKEVIFNDFNLFDEERPEVLPIEDEIEPDKINENAFIYLASIIYHSKNDWSIWLNNNKYTSITNNSLNEIYIKDINHSDVTILWKLSLSKWRILSANDDNVTPLKINDNNQVEIEFNIRPNQTFGLKREQITEGRIKFD